MDLAGITPRFSVLIDIQVSLADLVSCHFPTCRNVLIVHQNISPL